MPIGIGGIRALEADASARAYFSSTKKRLYQIRNVSAV